MQFDSITYAFVFKYIIFLIKELELLVHEL